MKVLVVLFILLLSSFCFAAPKTTEIMVFNPFGITVLSEIKCDHDYKTNKYKFYRLIELKKRSNILVIVPNAMKRCELWPLKVKIW